MTQESCYRGFHGIVVAIIAWVTDVLVPFLPMTFISRLIQFSAHTTFTIVKWLRQIQNKPIPPSFNEDFEERLINVKSGQLKWVAKFPERQENDPIILYLHGGGYGWALQSSQAMALCDLYFGVANPRLSILVLDYTTSVHAAYPTQLRETAEVYNALAAKCKNIILFGDSAGGHLSLQLMRHITAAEEGIPPVTQKPAAFVGISPAVDMALDPETRTHRNTEYDILSVHMMKGWGKMFIGNNEKLAQSAKNRLQFDRNTDWSAVLPPASKVFIAYGGREILVDSIETFIFNNDLKEKGCIIYAHPLDVHDSLMIIGSPSPMLKPTVEFLKSLC